MLLLSVAHKKSLYFGEKYENLNKCETICSVMLRKLLIVLFYLFGENALPILGCEIFSMFFFDKQNSWKLLESYVSRPWHYPENFGICSQRDRKSQTCFFTFLNVYIFWIERDKILISQLSPPKFKYFVEQNRPKRRPHENEFW